MLLIVGGEGSGKRIYAQSLGYDSDDMADGVLDNRKVVFHVERMVREGVFSPDLLFDSLKDKDIVICNEVGSGIIPLSVEDRTAREETGRLCTRLAGEADAVIRMVCGIPTVIKGEIPCR